MLTVILLFCSKKDTVVVFPPTEEEVQDAMRRVVHRHISCFIPIGTQFAGYEYQCTLAMSGALKNQTKRNLEDLDPHTITFPNQDEGLELCNLHVV